MIEMMVNTRISHKCQYRRHRLDRYMCPCAVKLAQLIDITRCASYDMSAMTNSAANFLFFNCVSFEQSVWCSIERGACSRKNGGGSCSSVFSLPSGFSGVAAGHAL